jgi:hypothetical protein
MIARNIRLFESQIADMQARINEIKAKRAKKKAARAKVLKSAKAPKATSSSVRKASVSHDSPRYGNGPAKAKKQKEYREDEDEDGESDEEENITLAQKQELAEKIQSADGTILSKAISIIQQTTNVTGVSPLSVHRFAC